METILSNDDGDIIFLGVSSATDEVLAFHYGNFDDAYGDGTVGAAAANGRVYGNTVPATLPTKFGTIGTPSTASGQTTYSWTPPPTSLQANVLVVAGGGGGGGIIGGGGGAGGVVYKTDQTLNAASYTIKVGNGGTGGNGWNTSTQNGKPGNDSVFGTYTTAKGGGGGVHHGGNTTSTIKDGGSGGGGANGSPTGGTSTQTDGYGNDGGDNGDGNRGAGGGGATEEGFPPEGVYGGDGGAGLYAGPYGETYGENGYFAGGGGGGVRNGSGRINGTGGIGGGGDGTITNSRAEDGKVHTGGGGGGGGYTGSSSAQIGGNGGSGIVAIRYIVDTTVIGINDIVTRNLAVVLDASSYSGTGTTWSDISGNGRNATIRGAVSWVNEGITSYFDFPGANADYINQTAGTTQIYKDMCIVFQYEDSGYNSLLANSTTSDKSLRISSNSIRNPGDGNDWAASATTYYVNGVADTNAVALSQNQWYILGGENKNASLLGAAWNYHIGTGYSGRSLNGKIAFLALYTAPLTATEHIENYNALKRRFGI